MLTLNLAACAAGATLPLAVATPAGMPAHLVVHHRPGPCPPAAMPGLAVGTSLLDADGRALLTVTGHCRLPARDGGHILFCALLTACRDLPVGNISLTPARDGISLAWITLSDKGSLGQRQDESGPLIASLVQSRLHTAHVQGCLLPDDAVRLRGLLTTLALEDGYDLIITTGGTGVAPTDVTPEATARVLDMAMPGLVQAMMQASLARTPMGAVSRARAGVLGKSLIINLPGSPKAVRENLEAVLPVLDHALAKLAGDGADCGRV